MNDEKLYLKARQRIENMKRKNNITDSEIIIELEKEIEHYRERINKFLDKSLGIKNNYEIYDREIEITIKDEEYLIKYNNNIDTVLLNVYVNKLIAEKDKTIICKKNEFKIINKTRAKRNEDIQEMLDYVAPL